MLELQHTIASTPFTINGRDYHPPARPIVAICVDGCADEYLNTAIAHGRMPNVVKMSVQGYRGVVRGALPSFTNVNNCAIVTGLPPRQTGIGGNYIIDPQSGDEVMTNSSRFLKPDTILAAAERTGRKVAMVTAKDKLRELLAKGLETGISFSAEKANQVTAEVNHIADVESLAGPTPAIYSGEASVYVLRAGVALIEQGLADFLYLSTTDYMQHRYAPDAPEAIDFYAALDEQIGRLLALDAVVALTADHGMNAKCDTDGQPNVVYLETALNEQFGGGCRVICPITDPYVAHHGALGSAVTVYLPTNLDVNDVAAWIRDLPGVTEVHDKASAMSQLELPGDHVGDLFVLAARHAVIGRTPEHHDLSQLHGSLRSHGGRYEELVPLIVSEPLSDTYRAVAAGDPRNFDLFAFACNAARTAQAES